MKVNTNEQNFLYGYIYFFWHITMPLLKTPFPFFFKFMEKLLKAQPCLIAIVLIYLYLHARFIKAGSVMQSAISCTHTKFLLHKQKNWFLVRLDSIHGHM